MSSNNTQQFVVTQHRATQNLTSDEHSSLGITTAAPKYPQYAMLSERLNSFHSWPAYLPLTADCLAEAGLVYTGVGDSVRCFYCGGGLRSWDEGDSPWVEHAKWYPHCPHVLLNKGQNYVERVGNGEIPEEGSAEGKEKDNETSNEEPLETAAAQSCIQMGIDQNLVNAAIQRLQSKGKKELSGAEICEMCWELENEGYDIAPSTASNVTDSTGPVADTTGVVANSNVADSTIGTTNSDLDNVTSEQDVESADLVSEDLEQLLEENERLKESKTCKICLDATASIIFLPCGHMVSCPQCAPALLKCPICRDSIKGRVKAYFA